MFLGSLVGLFISGFIDYDLLLNSELYLFWLYNKGKVKGNMLELYGKPLEELPILEMIDIDKKQLIKYVKEQEKDYSEDIQMKIDSLIYKAYNISDEEIKIIKEYIERKK